jgi:hypothetical protein
MSNSSKERDSRAIGPMVSTDERRHFRSTGRRHIGAGWHELFFPTTGLISCGHIQRAREMNGVPRLPPIHSKSQLQRNLML